MVLVSLLAVSVGCTKKEGGDAAAPTGDAAAPVEGAAAPAGDAAKEAEAKPENAATDAAAPTAENTEEKK